jgi:SAM-dependent methyltransferase
MRFEELQRRYHRDADAAHFAWQTRAPYFAATEARLVADVALAPDERLLEIGCGEGGNLYHLRGRGGARFGVDFSPAKAGFAHRATGAATAAADARHLPFADGSFDAVLIRDLLHHVRDRARVLDEAHRVLRARGRFTLIEPNVLSPLVAMQATVVPAERGLYRSHDRQLRHELAAARFELVDAHPAQPLPVWRALCHPRLGTARLGGRPAIAGALDSVERMAQNLVPRWAWLYLVYRAVRGA